MGRVRLFLRGIPWEPDIVKLERQFGVPEPNTLIPHETIAACLETPWKSSRYRGVLNAWRNRLKTRHGLKTVIVREEGLKVLTPPERVKESIRQLGFTLGHLQEIDDEVIRIPVQELDTPTRQQYDKLRIVTGQLALAGRNDYKTLLPAPPSQQKALPRITVVSETSEDQPSKIRVGEVKS